MANNVQIIPQSGSILYGDANKILKIQYSPTTGQPLSFSSGSGDQVVNFLKVSYDSTNATNKFEIPSKQPIQNPS